MFSRIDLGNLFQTHLCSTEKIAAIATDQTLKQNGAPNEPGRGGLGNDLPLDHLGRGLALRRPGDQDLKKKMALVKERKC